MKKIQLITVLLCTALYFSFQTTKEYSTGKYQLDETMAKGKALYEEKCILCHGLPKVEKLTKRERKKVVPKMAKMAKMTADEKDLMMKYVNSFAPVKKKK